ncbi:hypothetical protein C731_3415 [Mycolicibacterium hassiacum DSM 44199]|uniref:Uncharacterized protein n=1 Tax=Mycolicibacterium hassiacum (strain DSM 44199 / CIP 105218 / JCM 12690 / 3849) TaxID=1122247 RepID=K5BJ85_MYCHD|nr:hypothetical protein C731_3415 [Mycolicibacterium hassiacum DSM 44199]
MHAVGVAVPVSDTTDAGEQVRPVVGRAGIMGGQWHIRSGGRVGTHTRFRPWICD